MSIAVPAEPESRLPKGKMKGPISINTANKPAKLAVNDLVSADYEL